MCSGGIIDAETINKLSTGKVVPEAVGDCKDGSSHSSSVSSVTSKVHEMPEVGAIKQCYNYIFFTVFEGVTLKVSSANETVSGPDSDSGVTGRNTDLCVISKAASEDNDVPRS